MKPTDDHNLGTAVVNAFEIMVFRRPPRTGEPLSASAANAFEARVQSPGARAASAHPPPLLHRSGGQGGVRSRCERTGEPASASATNAFEASASIARRPRHRPTPLLPPVGRQAGATDDRRYGGGLIRCGVGFRPHLPPGYPDVPFTSAICLSCRIVCSGM
jgi:hypothetical protein